MRDVGRHDNRAGLVEKNNVCTCTFKLLYGREDREEDPNSGADHLVGGDYCGVIVLSKTNKYNGSESVEMVVCKYWCFGDVTCAQLEKSWSRNAGEYRAIFIVQEVAEGCNAMNEPCLNMSGNVSGSL